MSADLHSPNLWISKSRPSRNTVAHALWFMRLLDPIRPAPMPLPLRAACASKATCPPAASPNGSNKPAMPLSNLQSEILRLLAAHRDPESYVAGSTPLNRNTLRYSGDIDVFHDREEHVGRCGSATRILLKPDTPSPGFASSIRSTRLRSRLMG